MAAMAELCGNDTLHFIAYDLHWLMQLQYLSGYGDLLPSLNTVELRKDSGEEETKLTE
jgi:hypothetical protein